MSDSDGHFILLGTQMAITCSNTRTRCETYSKLTIKTPILMIIINYCKNILNKICMGYLTLQKSTFIRSSHQCYSIKKTTCARGSLLIKEEFSNLFKKKLWYRYFSMNLAKYLKSTPFLQNTSVRLLLLPHENVDCQTEPISFGLF